jgi:hypothetical protein
MDIAMDVLINTSMDVSFSKFKACLMMKVISETRCVHLLRYVCVRKRQITSASIFMHVPKSGSGFLTSYVVGFLCAQ